MICPSCSAIFDEPKIVQLFTSERRVCPACDAEVPDMGIEGAMSGIRSVDAAQGLIDVEITGKATEQTVADFNALLINLLPSLRILREDDPLPFWSRTTNKPTQPAHDAIGTGIGTITADAPPVLHAGSVVTINGVAWTVQYLGEYPEFRKLELSVKGPFPADT